VDLEHYFAGLRVHDGAESVEVALLGAPFSQVRQPPFRETVRRDHDGIVPMSVRDMLDLLRQRGGEGIKVFGGGGGVIGLRKSRSCTSTAWRGSFRRKTASAWACRE